MFDFKVLSWREKASGITLLLTKLQGLVTALLIMGQSPFARASLIATASMLAATFVLCGWELVSRRRPKHVCTCKGHGPLVVVSSGPPTRSLAEILRNPPKLELV